MLHLISRNLSLETVGSSAGASADFNLSPTRQSYSSPHNETIYSRRLHLSRHELVDKSSLTILRSDPEVTLDGVDDGTPGFLRILLRVLAVRATTLGKLRGKLTKVLQLRVST
jgi:hypothetical protein